MENTLKDQLLSKVIVAFVSINIFGLLIPLVIFWLSENINNAPNEYLYTTTIIFFAIIYFTSPIIIFFNNLLKKDIPHDDRHSYKYLITILILTFVLSIIVLLLTREYQDFLVYLAVGVVSILLFLFSSETLGSIIKVITQKLRPNANDNKHESSKEEGSTEKSNTGNEKRQSQPSTSIKFVLKPISIIAFIPLLTILFIDKDTEDFDYDKVQGYTESKRKLKKIDKRLNAEVERDYLLSRAYFLVDFNKLIGQTDTIFSRDTDALRGSHKYRQYNADSRSFISHISDTLKERNIKPKKYLDSTLTRYAAIRDNVTVGFVEDFLRAETNYYLVSDLLGYAKRDLYGQLLVAKEEVVKEVKAMQLVGIFIFFSSLAFIIITKKMVYKDGNNQEKNKIIYSDFFWILVLLTISLFQKIDEEDIKLESPYDYLTISNWYFPAALPELIPPREDEIVSLTEANYTIKADRVFEEILDVLKTSDGRLDLVRQNSEATAQYSDLEYFLRDKGADNTNIDEELKEFKRLHKNSQKQKEYSDKLKKLKGN